MEYLDKNKQLLFLGDTHGDWNKLLRTISSKDITNAHIISVGDIGMGFNPRKEQNTCKMLNDTFSKRNITFYGIRGNHDDPEYFNGDKRVNLSNFKLLTDYVLMKHNSKLIQFIGGAVSIDRTARRPGISFWENEGLNYHKHECQQVHILVTHTAPSWCFPQQFNDMVYGWAKEDAYLLEDLTNERAVMDEILKICQPTLHLYGHFHSSWTETINNCTHRLLNIDELWAESY